MSVFVDAHNHLHDARFGGLQDEVARECERAGVIASVVNGTSPDDWDSVTELAQRYSWILPSYGAHPWYIDRLRDGWFEELKTRLCSRPSAIGEIGIDHWKEGLDRELQETVFAQQLRLATQLNLPASIHGLKAWGRLLDLLRLHDVPRRGFLLHSYSGPRELVAPFVELGAYFSCAPSFLSPTRAKQLAVFREVPLHRLLPETDAPDQAPPRELNHFHLSDRDGNALNHPASIAAVYRGLSGLLSIDESRLSEALRDNFARLFAL